MKEIFSLLDDFATDYYLSRDAKDRLAIDRAAYAFIDDVTNDTQDFPIPRQTYAEYYDRRKRK